jgi:pimeloyl-ACP methyl ester carboxylesterase
VRTIIPIAILLGIFVTVSAQKPIDRKETIMIGGIKQFVWLKGYDDSKPIFLFLHGGPGNSVIPYAKKFCDQLYKHFVVVHWDQRAAGETAKLNPAPVSLTLDEFKLDTEALVDSLLHRFTRKKLFVAGHSWGTVLGFHLVRTKPEKVAGFIAIGSMVNQLESERIALEMMKARLLQSNDTTGLHELEKIDLPFQNGEQLYIHRKGLFKYSGSSASFSKTYVLDWSSKWLAVFNEASKENLFETLPRVRCPIYFFAGRNDLQTNSMLVEQYFKLVEADTKRFYWFENAGHGIPATKGAQMQAIIINEILSASRD